MQKEQGQRGIKSNKEIMKIVTNREQMTIRKPHRNNTNAKKVNNNKSTLRF